MQQTIYIDLLLIINVYITFFLLKGTAAFLHRKLPEKRILLASFIGGISALIILLPPLPLALNALAKTVTGLLLILTAFGYKSKNEFLKNAFVFIIINVAYAGIMLMVWFFFAPLNMEYNNGFAYFDIPFAALLGLTALSYGVIQILRYILDVKQTADRKYTLTISNNGKSVNVPALADTGNLLTDYFTGKPVIVCPYLLTEDISPENILAEEPPLGTRLLPYNTIDASGLIPVFKVDEIIIHSDGMPNKSVTALIGVTANNRDKCIFNPKLLV